MDEAWQQSDAADEAARHEEGGYIVSDPQSIYSVERWPRGAQSQIIPPPIDASGCYNGKLVVATFHTHPNPPVDESGRLWEQGPSRSDRRWHDRRRIGGFVISSALVYVIDTQGNSSVLGKREEVLRT